ncbi:hypothetical protein CPB84DRAFT_1747457 [Gymnopilus junonius]|uniref:GATA-type domain-containing protein n=1 Tax=Gymnopilus junonius TaxID=109634 RepID=A0A9P5NKP8_GYMJU|nr:hypothetical protein CPB84DRAFT_1747457 [Gymnopilus junonius]
MPSILNLKFKGNKSFVAFSNLNDTESLTKTWKVCTKVASYLEQGQRLENLSWRLWHLQNLIVDTDNAKSKREFKKLSKHMGDKLDKEKGRSIEELEAPDFKRNHSTDLIRQRAAEKERSREASQNAQPGTIKRMQFTFSVDQPTQPSAAAPVKKPDTKPSAEFGKRTRASAARQVEQDAAMSENDSGNATATTTASSTSTSTTVVQSVHFPSIFDNGFDPSALLYATPTLTNRMNYGEGFNPSASNDQFSISRPTIELPLDDILFNDDFNSDIPSSDWSSAIVEAASNTAAAHAANAAERSEAAVASKSTSSAAGQQQDVVMTSVAAESSPATVNPTIAVLATRNFSTAPSSSSSPLSLHMSDGEDIDQLSPAPSTARKTSVFKNFPPVSQAVKEILPETVAPSRINSIYGTRSSTPTGRPTLTLRTQSVTTRSSGPSATATSLNPAVLRGPGSGNSAPGGVKAECSNCGATHTPLWRRGLNDELNCNACGLYCKLHKRPRPKSMRNSHGETRAQAAPRQEVADVMVAAQCYNCHTTATPLWRKDDEGKTVCNACGLYYKLHGSARPISMKSDVIRKRSRHDARRPGASEDTPSASPGVSRRTSPVPETSPTLAPDSTTQMSYDYSDDSEMRTSSSSSELMGALGATSDNNQAPTIFNPFMPNFPGPYHPDYLSQLYSTVHADALPFSTGDSSEPDAMSPRLTKRRRMSTDSASEPPSSAVSYSSYSGDSFSSVSSSASHSKRASMEFPFSTYNSNGTINPGPALRGSGNTFWHPPMMPQAADNEPVIFHSNSNVSSSTSTSSSTSSSNSANEDSPMDYLHPPMSIQDQESLFSAYLHPPMALPEDKNDGGSGSLHSQMYVDAYTYH